MSSLVVAVICSIITYVSHANTFCEMDINGWFAPTIHRFEGKMNVPIKPSVEPGKALFLWPGLNVHAGEGGLMQPVLSYGGGGPSGTWSMAQWFSDCPDYCFDKYQPVSEGDTIEFYLQYIETYRNGSQHWEMGYSSYNDKTISGEFQVYRQGGKIKSIWATAAEFYLDATDSNNYDKLPASSFYTWDMYAYDSSNNQVKLSWTTNNDDVHPTVECGVSVLGDTSGTKISFPNNNGCDTSGYTRNWNMHCQEECGCNNNDGSKKVQCDYCCYNDHGSCLKENGPTPIDTESYTSECKDGYSREYNAGCRSYCGCVNDDGSDKILCDYCCAIVKDDGTVGYDYCDWTEPNTSS